MTTGSPGKTEALRLGTLAGILDEVAEQLQLTRAALVEQLFGPR